MILIIGIAISSLFLLTSCQKEDIYYIPLDGVKDENYAKKELSDPESNVFRDFGRAWTKAKVVPTWGGGDLICVYSIDEDNDITRDVKRKIYDSIKERPRSRNIKSPDDISLSFFMEHRRIFDYLVHWSNRLLINWDFYSRIPHVYLEDLGYKISKYEKLY